MMVRGTVADWEAWTGMAFPDSGPYVVPRATQPVVIDRERDEGVYYDQNVWMVHADRLTRCPCRRRVCSRPERWQSGRMRRS